MTSRRHCKHCLACGVPFWPGPYFAEEGPPRALKVISNGGDLKLFSRSRWVRTAASEKVRLHPNPTGFDAPADIIIFENEFGLLQIDGRPSLLSRSLYEITSCRLYGLKNFSLPTTLPFYCFCSVFQSFPLGESDDRSPVGLAVLPVVLLPLVSPPRCFFAASPAKLRFSKLRSTSQARRMTSRRHCKHCLACGVPFWPGPYFAEEGPQVGLRPRQGR